MAAQQQERPRGVWAAALTPLRSDLSPDTDALLRHYRWLLGQGCDGIVCLGTTGEANSFSVAERLALLESLAETELPEKLIVGTGCCAVPDTVRLTEMAIEMGAPGVLMLPPFYYKGVSDDGLFAAYAETIERVGDSRLKLYIYHFPKMTGLDLSLDLIERLIKAYPETVVGLKNSSGDWANISAMLEAFPGFDVFAGSEEFLLPTLRLGGPGCMSATVNVLAPETANLYANRDAADADARQARVTALRHTLAQFPAVPAMKAMLAARSDRADWATVRPPLRPADAAMLKRLWAELGAIGYDLAVAA